MQLFFPVSFLSVVFSFFSLFYLNLNVISCVIFPFHLCLVWVCVALFAIENESIVDYMDFIIRLFLASTQEKETINIINNSKLIFLLLPRLREGVGTFSSSNVIVHKNKHRFSILLFFHVFGPFVIFAFNQFQTFEIIRSRMDFIFLSFYFIFDFISLSLYFFSSFSLHFKFVIIWKMCSY